MNAKNEEMKKAILLRKRGYTYNEILKEVPVARSSISLWLKDLPLTEKEKKYLKKRTDSNISRGRIKAATANRENRLEREKLLFEQSKEEFREFVSDPLFHTGISLYWAEGSKRNTYFAFSNSDVEMVKVMILWIEKYLNKSRNSLKARIYAHKAYAHENIEGFWSKKLNIPFENFHDTIIKESIFDYKKRPKYRGCIRITTPNGSSDLRKTIFWKNMMVEYYHPK